MSHYATQIEPLLVSKQRLQGWIKRDIEYHKKKSTTNKQSLGYSHKSNGTDSHTQMLRDLNIGVTLEGVCQ